MERSKKIIQTSLIGMGMNVVLVLAKMTVGLISGSIAIVLDAVNNLSDALSSVITIVGTRLAGRKPDKKHPYGYGRIEYMTSMVISFLVLFAGITAGKESVDGILHPEAASYSYVTLLVIVMALAAKLLCGLYVKRVGKALESGALIASGEDALMDSIVSAATLVSAVISLIWNISIEAYLGLVIAVLIIKAGVSLLLETVDSIIGTRADHHFTKQLKKQIASYPGVHGAYDLVLHDYGPNKSMGSVHIEVPDDMPAKQIHHLSRRIIEDIYEQHGVLLTVGVYATNNTIPELAPMRRYIGELVNTIPGILQMHGFYGDFERKKAMFDFVIDFKADGNEIRQEALKRLRERFPDFHFDIALDVDFSD